MAHFPVVLLLSLLICTCGRVFISRRGIHFALHQCREYYEMLAWHIPNLTVVDLDHNFTANDTLVFFSHFWGATALPTIPRLVLINTEQMSQPTVVTSTMKLLKSHPGLLLVDYSPANLRILAHQSGTKFVRLRARYVPLVPPPPYVSSPYASERLYDIGMVASGSKNPGTRRRLLVDKLRSQGINVTIIHGWGAHKVAAYKQLRVLVNFHKFPTRSIAEQLRIVPAFAAGCVVVTETSIKPATLFEQLMISAKEHSMVHTITHVLKYYTTYITWQEVNWVKAQDNAGARIQEVFINQWQQNHALEDWDWMIMA